MRRCSFAVLVAMLLFPGTPSAFERDVHFGLTKWLALKAGFTDQQADALATGDQRVDSGDMQFIELVTAYACLARNKESSTVVQRHHFPSAGTVPSAGDQRAVIADSDQVRRLALDATKVSQTQAGFLLFKIGEALHALQDSWSHQGVPDLPRPLQGAVACDPAYSWAHSALRGGWNSHKADLTQAWPTDTLAMAKASYEVLQQYPAIAEVRRSPKDWGELVPSLEAFTRASTKTEKKKWFVGQGIAEVSFLEGVSLPDGAEPFALRWNAQRLPRLAGLQSRQHHVDAELLAFYSKFFSEWMSSDDFEALAVEFGVPSAARSGRTGARSASPAAMDKPELAARLRVWRIRDHGRVAELAHALQPLSAAQRKTLSSMNKDGKALVRYPDPVDAFFPLEVKGSEPSPLSGFIVNAIERSATGNERAVATTKLRHAPYDTVVVLSERVDGRWRIVSLGATVEH